jgi:hypothetical protein
MVSFRLIASETTQDKYIGREGERAEIKTNSRKLTFKQWIKKEMPT